MATVAPLFPSEGSRLSGHELPHGSTEVWGLTNFNVAHHWTLRTGYYTSKCGHIVSTKLVNGQNRLFEPGNFRKCKTCMERLRRSSVRRGIGSY